MSQVWVEKAGRNLRLARESRGWSQEYVAKRLREISGDPTLAGGKETISSIERGQHTPPWTKMLHLARFFETSIEQLAELETGHHNGPSTHADVIYVQNMHGNCVLGGLGLALDPEAIKGLGDVLTRHPEVVQHLLALLQRLARDGQPRQPEHTG